MCSTTVLKSSMLFSELHSIPLLKSAGAAYGRIKESSRLAATGLTVLEYSCTTVLEKIYDGSKVAHSVDELAGKGVAKLVDHYPSLNNTPEEIQMKTTSTLKSTIRSAMKTPPGQLLLKGLDWALDRTEGLLRSMKPLPKSPKKKRHGHKHLPGEHSYALDDSGACDSDAKPGMLLSDAIPAAVDRLVEPDETILGKMFRLTCILPLETTVSALRSTRRYLGGRRRKSTHHGDQSPDSRRKVSPKKKIQTSLIGKMKSRAFTLLGYGPSISLGELKDENLGKAEEDDDKLEKKRKHEEIVTDPDSDSSCDNIDNFDSEDYDSGEDPDYQPSESAESELNDDVSDAASESDVEIEEMGIGKKKEMLVQIKEDKVKHEVKDEKIKEVKDDKLKPKDEKMKMDLKDGKVKDEKVKAEVKGDKLKDDKMKMDLKDGKVKDEVKGDKLKDDKMKMDMKGGKVTDEKVKDGKAKDEKVKGEIIKDKDINANANKELIGELPKKKDEAPLIPEKLPSAVIKLEDLGMKPKTHLPPKEQTGPGGSPV